MPAISFPIRSNSESCTPVSRDIEERSGSHETRSSASVGLSESPPSSFDITSIPVLGLLVSPGFQTRSALSVLEKSINLVSSIKVKPLAPVAAKLGGAATAFWAGVAALFGAGVGVVAAGPGPAMRPAPEGLDFSTERLQKLLNPKELLVLTSYMAEHPEDKHLMREALREASPKEQREALRAIIRIIVPHGESVRVETPNGEILFEHVPKKALSFELSAKTAEGKNSGPCPLSMVYVSKEESGLAHALCVDEDDNPAMDNPNMPMVNVSFAEAEAICAAGKGRLPSPQEYKAVASFGGKRNYPTQDNTPRGVHFNADAPRRLRFDPANNFIEYTQPDGTKRKIYNLTGNVWKLLADTSIGGGSWLNLNAKVVKADSRDTNDSLFDNGHYVGFRCVSSPQDSKK